jgi:hypothetical protein
MMTEPYIIGLSANKYIYLGNLLHAFLFMFNQPFEVAFGLFYCKETAKLINS